MANPRDSVGFDDIGTSGETFEHDDTIVFDATESPGNSAQVGLAVTLRSDGVTVGLAGDGEQVEGRLVKVEAGGFCGVHNKGNVRLPAGDGASITPGKAIVGDLGEAGAEGYIREVATGTAAELGVARGRIKDNSDTEAVVVDFG